MTGFEIFLVALGVVIILKIWEGGIHIGPRRRGGDDDERKPPLLKG